MIQFLKSIFSNVWTYLLIIFIFIPTILAVDLVQHYRNNQIVEVLEQVEEPEKTIEVVNAVPDQEFQNISLRDESQGIFWSDDFIDGGITGELRFNYNFDDGSSSTELFDVEEYFNHNIPGKGSKRLIKGFVKGKYKIRSGEIIEKDSSKKLSVGDFTDEDFNYQYEWLSFARNLDPINTKAYFSKKTSNGKVTRYNEVPYNIKMIP